MSQITRVVTEADHDMALARISEFLDAELNTQGGEELDRLSTLVEAYEAEHCPIEDPYPGSMIEFLIDQAIVFREQMEALAGGSDDLDAMIAGRMPITAEVAQLMHERSSIPMEFFLNPPGASGIRRSIRLKRTGTTERPRYCFRVPQPFSTARS